MKTIKVVRVIGGKRNEIEISAGRARELGISDMPSPPVSVAYLMDGLFVGVGSSGSDQMCSVCGTTLRDVLLRHRVGCAHCYDSFAPSIGRLLKFHYRTDRHHDRLPVRLQRYRNLLLEREALQHRLTLAVESEDFESAAEIRDRIGQIGITDGESYTE